MQGIQIKELREEIGLTQTQLGLVLGVHHMTVSKWERGSASPEGLQLDILCHMMITRPLGLASRLRTSGSLAALRHAIAEVPERTRDF